MRVVRFLLARALIRTGIGVASFAARWILPTKHGR